MASLDGDRATWIAAAVVALAIVGVAWFIETSMDQRGIFFIGLVGGGAVLAFTAAMTSVVGQNACEACGIGNPPGATTCWKCGADLAEQVPGPASKEPQEDDRAEQDEQPADRGEQG